MPSLVFSREALLDPDRLAAIRRYHQLFASGSESFDRLTRLTSRMLDVPMAIVTMVAEDRQILASCIGVPTPAVGSHGVPLSHSFCTHSVTSGKPLIIEDAREHPLVRDNPAIGEMNVIAYAGIPLITSEGHVLGSFCAVDHRPRRWSERDLEFLTGMAATVMAEIEARAENAERRRIEALHAAEQKVLERISRAEPLEEVLGALVRVIEEQTEGAICSVLLLDPESRTLGLGAAASLPDAYNRAIEGLPVDEGVGSCGTAAHRNEPVIVASIADDPLWRDYRDLAREHGLAACWSHPIRDRDGSVLGTFAVYSRAPREPAPHERQIVERAANLATVAIERHQADSALRLAKEQQDAILHHMPSAAWLKDRHGRYLAVSRVGASVFGRDPHELIGKTDLDLFPAKLARSFVAEDQRAMAEGSFRVGEKEITGPEGMRTWEVVKVAYLDGVGEVAGTAGIAHDVTERVQAEEALRESQRMLSTLMDNLPGMAYRCRNEADWGLELVSKGCLALTGYDRDDLTDGRTTSYGELIHPDDRGQVWQDVQEALARQQPFQLTYRIRTREGEEKWVWEQGQGVYEQDGAVQALEGLILDVSERRKTVDALRESELRFRQLAENIREIFWVFDADFQETVYVSPAYEEIWGRSLESIYSDPASFLSAVHPDDVEHLLSAMRQVKECPFEGIAYRIRRPNGEVRWLWSRGYPVRNARGEVYRIVGTTEDITERKAMEAERSAAEAHYRRLVENAPYGIYALDRKGRFTEVNAAGTEILGRDSAELIGRPFSEVIVPEDLPRAAESLRRKLSGEVERSDLEVRLVHASGSHRLVHVRAAAIRENGEITGTHGIVRDITEEAEQERQLRRVERLASVGTLIGGVAHELNNPLHAIRNFAELMLLEERNPDDQEALEIVKREADRAAKVVADLRLIARNTQEEPGQRVAVDLNDAVRHVLKVRHYALETGNVEVRADLAEALPPVLANRGEIEQVVLNLVVNAEQAMDEAHRGERRLVLRTRRTPEGASVHVVDSGPGIPPQHLERIFDPFFTTKPPGEGTGLGLSLVHSIVSEHGGAIHVDSEWGKGTVVRVDLPRAPSEPDAATPDEGTPAASARSLRVLVVDDEAAIRRVSVRYLERLGHVVDAAADGGEAMRLVAEREYDVIISDLRMPGLDGEDLLARLRMHGRDLERRLIFMTGDAASPRAARVVADANVPVLIKPVRLEDLASAVERISR